MRRMYSSTQLEGIANRQVQQQVSSGNLQNVKVFEEIVDKNSHKRFIEGNITIEEISGVTKTYGKWSLSGSHLLIVLAVSLANGTTIASNTKIASVDLPLWVKNKIVPLLVDEVTRSSLNAFNTAGSSQNTLAVLRKSSSNEIKITLGALTLTDDRYGRISFDLLIDDDE